MNNNVYAIILVGGKGARLWPLSLENYSKPFIEFGKRKTLIENTMERIKDIVDKKHIMIVVDKVKFRLLKPFIKGVPKGNILVEPFGRNTAAAVGLAAINLSPESIMLIIPADQLVKKLGNYKRAIREGIGFVRHGKNVLLCVGTVPTSARTSFGYIGVKGFIKGNIGAVERFIEKPSQDKAKRLFLNPHYLWNAGIFIFRAGTILEAIKKYAPALYKNLEDIKTGKTNIKTSYRRMKDISIDYQIMEKAKNLYCLKAKFMWQDIGNWISLGNLFSKDRLGNVRVGKSTILNVTNSIILNWGKGTIGVIGLKDIVIVETNNGTLICRKEDVEKVKELSKLQCQR